MLLLDSLQCSAQSRGGAISGTQASSVTLTNTLLTNNSCLGNGGGLHTAGRVIVRRSNVTNNSAGLNGGAIFSDFAAVCTVDSCALSGNIAKQSGGAWFGFGNSQQLQLVGNTSFSYNAASCCYAAGYGSRLLSEAASHYGTSSEQTCADADSGEGGADCCYNMQYSDGKTCLPCLDGGDCSTVGASVTTQSLKPGRWRASPETIDIRECWVEHACTGGRVSAGQNATTASRSLAFVDLRQVVQTSRTYCAPGYEGPCE